MSRRTTYLNHPFGINLNPQLLKNRKLILNEYNEKGKLIDSRELNDWHLISVLGAALNYKKDIDILRKSIRDEFTNDEWELINLINNNLHNAHIDFDQKEQIDYLKELLKQPREKIKFACSMYAHIYKKHIPTLESPYPWHKLDFFEALEFIEHHSGIYYSVNNEGIKTHNFVVAPTRNQAKYRRNKYSERIVFLSFDDWKDYLVCEDELR